MYQCVAIYGTVGTAAIDVAPDVRYVVAVIVEGDGLSDVGIGDMHDGIAIDSAHLLVGCSLRLRQTLTASIYRTVDVATDDVHQGAILACCISCFCIDYTGIRINLGFADWLDGIIRVLVLRTHVSHISTAKDLAIDLSLIRYLYQGDSVNSGYILEVDAICCFRCYTSTTTKYITIYIATTDIDFCTCICCVVANLSGSIVFDLVRITESATIYTVKEGITCYDYLGSLGYFAGISATQNTEDGEVWNTLGIIEDWEGSGIGIAVCIAVGTGAFA